MRSIDTYTTSWDPTWTPVERDPQQPLARPPTRTQLGLETGGIVLGPADAWYPGLRVGATARVELPFRLDVDFAYAGYFDFREGERLGLGHLGLAYRVVDVDFFVLRVGARAIRMRDPLGAVNGGEWLTFGLTYVTDGIISAAVDLGSGKVGEAFFVSVRGSLGISCTRGVEVFLALEHLHFLPRQRAEDHVGLTSIHTGMRLLL